MAIITGVPILPTANQDHHRRGGHLGPVHPAPGDPGGDHRADHEREQGHQVVDHRDVLDPHQTEADEQDVAGHVAREHAVEGEIADAVDGAGGGGQDQQGQRVLALGPGPVAHVDSWRDRWTVGGVTVRKRNPVRCYRPVVAGHTCQ
jgi:hypothetical protein